MGRRSVYFPDELEPRIEAAAAADERNFSSWVTLVVKRALPAYEQRAATSRPDPDLLVAASELALERQAKLNAAKAKPRKAGS